MTGPKSEPSDTRALVPMPKSAGMARLMIEVASSWLERNAALTPAPAQPAPRTDGAPAEIWLQLHGDGEPDGSPVDYRDEVSWCWEKIHDHDVRYVLADTPPTLTDAQCDAIRAEERERCAKVVEDFPYWLGRQGRIDVAAAIRAAAAGGA